MEIIIPFIILGGLALIFAIILAIAGIKLAVVQDKRVEQVYGLLSGANCGGCGYAGCEAFAKALVEGKAGINDCPSTSKESKEQIANIIGGEIKELEETIVVCTCNGGKRCLDKYEYQGYGDCASIELLAGGRKACPTGCIGAGKCTDVCAFHAVDILGDGVAVAKVYSMRKLCHTCPKSYERFRKGKVYIACSNHGKERKSGLFAR